MIQCVQAKKVDPKKDAKGKDKGGKAAPSKSAGGKAKKKSWTKVKIKEKLNNAVFLDQKAYDRIAKDIPRFLVVTVSELCNKFKVNGSVARKLLTDLSSKNLIKQVGDRHAGFTLYTGTQSKIAEKPADKK